MKKVMWLHKETEQVMFDYEGYAYVLFEGFGTRGCSYCDLAENNDFGEGCNQGKSQAISCYAGGGDYAWKKIVCKD